MEPAVRAIVAAMIDGFAGRGRADLVAELAYELPALVIFRMLGIPDADVPQVKEWAHSRVAMNFGDRPVSEQAHHAENLVSYWRYCQELVASRLREPRDDLPGALARIYLEGEEEIEPDEIAALVYGQLTAGHETTTALLSNGLKELLAQREAWDAICADARLIPGAVEEMLRVGTPVFTLEAADEAPGAHRRRRPAGGDERPAAARLGQPRPDRVPRPRAASTCSARTPAAICRSASASTSAWARRWPAWRRASCSRSSPAACRTLRLVDGQTFDFNANSSFRGPSRGARRVRRRTRARPAVRALPRRHRGRRRQGARAWRRSASPACPSRRASSSRRARSTPCAPACASASPAVLAALDAQSVTALEDGAREVRALLEQAPLPPDVERRSAPATPRSATTRRSRCARARLPRTPPRRASPASRTPTCGSSAPTRSSSTCAAAGQPVLGALDRLPARRAASAGTSIRMAVVVQRDGRRRRRRRGDDAQPGRTATARRSSSSRASGLGETVVGGEVTPGHFLVDKVMLEMVELAHRPKGGRARRRRARPAASSARGRGGAPDRARR